MVLNTIQIFIPFLNQVGAEGWEDQCEREEAALVPRRLHLHHALGRPHCRRLGLCGGVQQLRLLELHGHNFPLLLCSHSHALRLRLATCKLVHLNMLIFSKPRTKNQ